MNATPDFQLDNFLPYRLSVAANAVSDAVSQTYRKAHGLRPPEWRLVAVLAECPALTPLAIGQRTRMDKVTVSRASVVLLDKGLIGRAPNPLDSRSLLLSLTDAGQALYNQVAPQALEVQARIFSGFTDEEARLLLDLLQRAEAAAMTEL